MVSLEQRSRFPNDPQGWPVMRFLWGFLLLLLTLILTWIILLDGLVLVVDGSDGTLSQHIANLQTRIIGPLLFTHSAACVGGMLMTHFSDGISSAPHLPAWKFRWGIRVFGAVYILMLIGLGETASYLLCGMALPASPQLAAHFPTAVNSLTSTHLLALVAGLMVTQVASFRMTPKEKK